VYDDSVFKAKRKFQMKRGIRAILTSLPSLNLHTVMLAILRPSGLVPYVSGCLRKYDELAGNGLPSALPPMELRTDATITIPAIDAGGGMSYRELVILARITMAINGGSIFEIGTYNGLTTSVFVLNSIPGSAILTLDLPEHFDEVVNFVESDRGLVSSRRLGLVPSLLGLENRYTQLRCDSMVFDPANYIDSVGLGLIDGAHDLAHVQKDTMTMARMITADGIVLWHDYGGKGRFRPLTEYLNTLGRRAALYRIPDTQLASAQGNELKKAIGLTQ
jgi:hypothetical protein